MSELARRILDASVALVAEKGVRGVSFREVARRAGVSHQAPYHEFGDYRGIMRAIAREGFEQLNDGMASAAADESDPLDGLVAAGIAYVRFARSHVGHFRVMFQRSLVDLHDPEVPMPEAEQTYETLIRLSHETAAAGYARGLSGQQVAHVAWSAVHGLAILQVEDVLVAKTEEPVDDDAVTRDVVKSLGRLFGARD